MTKDTVMLPPLRSLFLGLLWLSLVPPSWAQWWRLTTLPQKYVTLVPTWTPRPGVIQTTLPPFLRQSTLKTPSPPPPLITPTTPKRVGTLSPIWWSTPSKPPTTHAHLTPKTASTAKPTPHTHNTVTPRPVGPVPIPMYVAGEVWYEHAYHPQLKNLPLLGTSGSNPYFLAEVRKVCGDFERMYVTIQPELTFVREMCEVQQFGKTENGNTTAKIKLMFIPPRDKPDMTAYDIPWLVSVFNRKHGHAQITVEKYAPLVDTSAVVSKDPYGIRPEHWLAIAIGAVAFLLLVYLLGWIIYKRRNKTPEEEHYDEISGKGSNQGSTYSGN